MGILFPLLMIRPTFFVQGFLQPRKTAMTSIAPWSSTLLVQSHSIAISSPVRRGEQFAIFMSDGNEDEDDDDDDDDDIDPNALGDWRTFRMNLANSGLSSSSESISSIQEVDGINLVEEDDNVRSKAESLESWDSSSASSKRVRPKSVSKKNEQLLKGQNEALAEEYLNGVWAHESSIPEVGGLVCRMPLEAEIYRGSRQSTLYKKLQHFLDSDEYDRTSIVERSKVKLPAASSKQKDEDDEMSSSSFSPLAAKTAFWYRGAEKLLKKELETIAAYANANGKIDAESLSKDSLELLQLYMDQQQTWQEVCLVIERDEKRGSAKTLTVNRPMAFKLSESMGRLVLNGAYGMQKNGKDTQDFVKFLSAFESACGVYVGGPDNMEEPATMIHGISDLPGAQEISPGTGIYKGGLEAAMDGVLEGKYKPLDFRFFIGHTSYTGGELDRAVARGSYQPVATCRSLILKQCLRLPKPLWHEVLEFCGGELREISKLEFMKREDLQ
mmetsp:Transcript_10571/g.22811  ORF Transcript_10571/g.22811 Transcript_10571/m.22811 type:complete len:499 (+) Transcript_10571:1-1497(+)